MKHFKLMKGVLACLLSLALVVTCFTVSAKAADKGTAKTTFTVTIGETSYTYEVAKNADATADTKVSLADITKNAKNSNKSIDEMFADGIIVTAVKKGGSDIAANDVAIGYNSTTNEFTIKKQAEGEDAIADVTIAITAVPKKINYVFSITYGDPEVTYTAKLPVDNLNDNTKKVSFTASDIIAAAINGEGTSAKKLAAENVVLVKVNNVDVDSAEYTFEQAYTDAYRTADVAVSDNVAEAAIENISYDPTTDSVVIETAVKDVTISYSSVKAASANKISKFSTLKAGEDQKASIALNNNKAGIKVAENKDAFLYVVAGAATVDKKATYAANVTVKATSYKKIAVNFNYAKAAADINDIPLASVILTPNSGEAKTYTPASDNWNDIVNSLQYSIDNGATWLNVKGENEEVLADYRVRTAPDNVVVTITDYTKLIDGAFTYDTTAGEFKKTDFDKKVSSNNTSLTVTGTNLTDTEDTTYKYVAAVGEVGDEDYEAAKWVKGSDTTAINLAEKGITVIGTPKANDTITVTVKPVIYKLSDGATVSTEGATLTGESVVTLAEVMDDGKLTGAKLYAWTLVKKAPKVQFRVSGADKNGNVAAYRNSKTAKGSIKKAAKAPKIKTDAVKGTIAIKNGFDYVVKTAEVETIASDEWTTILPMNKEGKAANAKIATSDYVPAKKCTDATKNMFTSESIKTLSIEDLFESVKEGNDYPAAIYVYVRKSAADGKPASAVSTVVKIDKPTAGPVLTATDGKYAQAAKNEKGTALAIPEIANATGDESAAAYEYLIIKASDKGKVNYASSKWSKFVTGKTLVVDKTKSKYVVGTEKKEATLGTDCIILIRRSGNKKAGVLPSSIIETKVVASKVTVDEKQVDGFDWVANS